MKAQLLLTIALMLVVSYFGFADGRSNSTIKPAVQALDKTKDAFDKCGLKGKGPEAALKHHQCKCNYLFNDLRKLIINSSAYCGLCKKRAKKQVKTYSAEKCSHDDFVSCAYARNSRTCTKGKCCSWSVGLKTCKSRDNTTKETPPAGSIYEELCTCCELHGSPASLA
uniref:Uncharacterized protein n=1 Tax=Mucochytrium quahogii TaxID=96639 RepID=A0A7S2RFB1_9STRA|mmetsp:Transcript_14268/g.30880  ORF Transcript_14268/g.30880 Transcript_14268/m.30880 type:complete len:168 (+) Transcript_14268:132-635(+)